MAGPSCWRLGDVVLAVQTAPTFDDAAFAALLDEALADQQPFLRVVLWADPSMAVAEGRYDGRSVPVAVIGGSAALTDSLSDGGFNARRFEPSASLEALVWLVVDGARSRAMLRALQPDAGSSSLGPFIDALKTRAATPGTLAADAERIRVARDLHDGVCSSLAGLRMRLGVMTTMHADGPLQGELEAVGLDLDDILDDLRSIAWVMRVGEPTWQQLSSYLIKRTQEVGRGAVELTLRVRGADNLVHRELATAIVHDVRHGAARLVAGGRAALHLTVAAGADEVTVELQGDEGRWGQRYPSSKGEAHVPAGARGAGGHLGGAP